MLIKFNVKNFFIFEIIVGEWKGWVFRLGGEGYYGWRFWSN